MGTQDRLVQLVQQLAVLLEAVFSFRRRSVAARST